MNHKNRKIIAIIGPTASGKTGIGVKLAKEFDGEIISADSRQVYKGLDLGTGKDLVEFGNVKYHMIDICEPGERFTLFDYLPLARKAIKDVFKRGKVPIVVGGTGLYIQGIVEGFELARTQNTDNRIQKSRERLEKLTVGKLQNILKKVDPESYAKIDTNNPHRLIRAIERAQEGNTPTKNKPDFEVLQIGINWPRETLCERIDKRVEERFKEGMLEEIEGLLKEGVRPEWLIGLGLEYREITNYVIKIAKLLNCSIVELRNNSTIQQSNNEFGLMKDQLKLRIRQFSRRQMTWFKRFPEIIWENDYSKISKIAKDFLK